MKVKFVCCLLWVVSIGISGCVVGEHHAEESLSNYLVTSPLVQDTVFENSYVCQIQAIRHIEVRALEKGYLEDIFVDEGAMVAEGQRMFQITPLIYQAELQRAQAEERFVKIELENTRSLADSQIVSANELALVEARHDKALAEVALAQVHLDFTLLRAPFSGIMDQLRVRKGSLIEEGELLTTLSDNSQMWVYFNVPEAEYLDYSMSEDHQGRSEVKLMMANGREFEHGGVVETIEADFNPETGNIPFRATFPNPRGLLRHGETGSILMRIPIQHAILIPQKATYEILDKKYVFVVGDDGVVRSRQVVIQEELPHLYVVGRGLKADEKILVEGLRKVKDGDRIGIRYETPEEVFGHLQPHAE